MATNIYEPGDIVWVKLSNSWWPGEVWDPTQVPDDLSSLKKEPIAVVKFFKEDSYEYVKNSTSIFEYNCHRKKDFIKKGLELHRTSNNSFSQKFREDIVRAERLTGGDINILENNEKKSVSKRSNIVKMIFGDQTPSNQKKSQQQSNKSQHTNIIEKSPTIISKLKGRSIVTVKNIIKPSTPTASSTNSSPQKPNNSNPSTPSNGIYKCHLCPFTSMRQNVIILHSKSHLNQSGSSLNSTISPRLASENSRFSIPMPISNISKDSSVIVIDDDSDSDILSRTQTPQTVVTTIDTSSDSQIIDVSLSPQESSSSSSSGIKTIAAQKILPSRINIVGSDKKKKIRGNKGVNSFYVSTPIKTSNINEIAENNEINKTNADHIPLIKPPKKQFRKGILKDIYEDWSDEDSTPNNVKETANKDDADEGPNKEAIQNNKNLFEALGCSRLDESDVEVLKNLQHAERNDKGKSPVTTQKIRNIPKKDRQRNIVLEDFSDSSSNVTPNQNIILENREILPSPSVPLNVEKLDNANNTNLVNIEKIKGNENTKLVQEAEKVMADKENNSSELECKTDNINEPIVISVQNESTACKEPSENQNEICEEPNYSVTLDVNISKNDEIIDKESNKENVIDEQVEEEVKNNIENIQTILPETSSNFIEKDNLHICNVVIEKCSENDLIESPEFEPIDDAQKMTLSSTQSKESEESVLIDKENEIIQSEEYSTVINDVKNLDSLVTKESYLKESTNITDYEICKISDQTQLGIDEITQNLNEESNTLDSSKDLVSLEKENFLNKEIIIDQSKESPLNNVDKISFENDNIEENINEVVENVNEELLNEKTLENMSETDKTYDNTYEELNVNISEDKSSEMQKPHGRSKRSVAQASKTIGHKIRKSSRKSDNIYKYLGREITTPSPIVTSESTIYTKLESSLGDLNESCNTTISIQFTENLSESNKELISSDEKEKLINEDTQLNIETNFKNHDEDNIEKIDKDIEEKINRKNRKKQRVDTVEKKQSSDSDKFIEFLENEIKTTPCKISILENLKENINETFEQEKSGNETEITFVQEKPVGRTLRERKIRKEYAELDEDSLLIEEKFEKQITDVENNSNLENKFEKSKELDASNNQAKVSIKLKKSLLKHNKPSKSLISEPKTSNLQEEREVIPKLIIKSSKESGKEGTLKVMTVTHQRPQNENIIITELSPSENETKTITEKQSPKSPKKPPKKSYIKQKPSDRKLFKKESPEKQKCEKTYKEDTPAAVFDFQEEDDTELVLTSLSKLKKKYMSPDKIKEPVLLPDVEKQKEIEKNDEKLKAEIENLLNDTKLTDVSLTKGSEKIIESTPNNNNVPSSNLNDEVKALPIKERGKRFFKSRNVSRNDDSQSHLSVCISGTSSSEKSNVIELVNSNVEPENLKTENVFEIPKTEDPKSTDKILQENKRKQFKTLEETTTSPKICEKNSEKIYYSNSNNIDENIKSNSSSITQEIICNNTNKSEPIIEKINSFSNENAENPSEIDLKTSEDNHEMLIEKSEANLGHNQDSALLEIKSDNSNNLQHELIQKSHLFEVSKTDSNVMSQDENIVLLPEIKTELIEPEVVNKDEKLSDIKMSSTIQSNEKTTQINPSLLSGNNIVRRRRSHLKVTPRKRSIPEGSVVNETSLEESQSKIAKFVEIPIDQSNTNVTNEKNMLPTDVINLNQQGSLYQDQFQELGKHLEVKNSDNKIKQFFQETVDFQSPVNEEDNENLLSQENNKNESIKVKDSETVENKGKELCDPIPQVSNVDKSIVNEISSNELQKETVKEDHAQTKSNDCKSTNQESLLTKNLKENDLSQNFEEEKPKEISNFSLNESLTRTSILNERKREKSITEQYEENFVEKYMKDAGISNLSSPNPQTRLENISDLDNIVLDSGRSSNSNENKDHLSITAESLNDIIEKTKETENVEILSHTQEKTNLLNTYEIPLIEQAKAIVAKVPSTQSLSDIRSFRPKRKHSSRQSSISNSENIITTDILSAQSPTVLHTKRSNKKHLMEEKDIENKNVNNVNDETMPSCTDAENNVCDNENKIPTCPDFKILEAVDKLAEVQQNANSMQTSSTPSGNARITVDSENPLSVQIANILASNSDFKNSTETEIESKSILNISPNESILNKKRKLSFEEDIPTFIIDKTAASNTSNDKLKESSIKQQLIKNSNESNKIENVTKLLIANNSLEEKEKDLSQHEIISNIEEIVSEETPSACLKIKDSSQSSNENLSSLNTLSTTTSDTATTENVFDISNLPILLTTNEEILQDNIQFVITQESTLVQEDQQDTATQTISATTLQEAVTEQIIIPTAKKIRGRPRKSDPSLPQPTTTIVTGYNQTTTNSVASSKLPVKTTQQISLNQKTNSNQKGLIKKTQQNMTSPTLSQATVENTNQTYNVKATSSRELGVDASGNSIVLIQYGRNNQTLMKIPKTPTEQLQTTTSMDITHAKEQISKTSDKLQKPVQQLQSQTQKPQLQLQPKNVSHHRSGQVILSNKGTIVQTTENISQPTNISQSGSTYLNVGNKPASSNEVIITPIYESGNVAPKSNQQQLPQVQQPAIPQNSKAKKSHIQRTTYVGSENSEIIIRQIQQQQHEQQQQKHLQITSSTQRGRKRKELEPPNTVSNPNVNTLQRNKQQKLYQSNTNKIPTHNQTATSSSTSSYDNSKTQMLTQIDSTSSAINNQPKGQQQSPVQQQQHHLQQQQNLLQQQQQHNSQQTQQQQQQQIQQSKSMIEEEIAANKIMAVPANHFGIPGSAYYLCSQDNEGNYMPIDNQELYLDPESNQLVPLSVLNAKTTAAVVAAAAAQTSSGLIDGSQQLNLIEANTDDGTSICMEINDSNKQHENTSDNNNIASTENVEAQQFIQTNNLAELSNILGPDQSICINIDGQQLILDQQSFLALVAAGGENTQLETQDGQILQLTSEFLAALGIGVSNNDNVSSESGAGGSNGGDENSSGAGEQQIILQTSNDEMATNTDILASALIDDVLQIETSQGVQLVNAVSTGVVTEETLGPAFQPLTPPVTAQTSETNALLTQPPIMSTLEVPSNKKKQSSKQLDTNAILLNTITGTTACGNNVINNNNLGSNRSNANINNNSNINCSERLLATPQNLEDCIAFIGVSTQSSTVPSSLELPITVTNPAIAPPKTSAPLGGLFNTKNLIVESSQISPQMVSSISSDPELQLELFTTSSASSSSIGNNSSNNINNNIIKGNRNNIRNNNDGNVGDNVVACNIEIEKFNESSKQQDVVCAESGLNDFTNQSTIGSLSFEDPNR